MFAIHLYLEDAEKFALPEIENVETVGVHCYIMGGEKTSAPQYLVLVDYAKRICVRFLLLRLCATDETRINLASVIALRLRCMTNDPQE